MQVKIEIDSVDVTRDVAPYLVSVAYEDVLSGQTDSLEIQLADAQRKFLTDWFPPKGATLKAAFLSGKEIFDLGAFEVDELDYSLPPSVMKVKANSCPQLSSLRQVNQSRSWENVRLSHIAADIASDAGVSLFYKTTYDPQIVRAEQKDLSAMNFLESLCAKYYLSLKFADNQLIIYETSDLEKEEPVCILKPAQIMHFTARSTLSEIYKSCEVKYHHGQKSQTLSAKVEDSTKAQGKVLKINRKVENQGEAERLARNELRQKNKEELKITVEMRGTFELVAGLTVELAEFGAFCGKYLIEKARHRINQNGYQVSLELRRAQ